MGLGARDRGPDMRARGQGPDNPNSSVKKILAACETQLQVVYC